MAVGRPLGSARPPVPATVPEDLVGGYDVSWAWTPNTCGTCGRPAGKAELLVFRLWSVRHNRWAGYYLLCDKCWARSNDRPDPDPLHAPGD